MHAWLAEIRDAELRDKKRTRVQEGNKRLALRTIDLEALADVLARTSRWDKCVAPAAAAVDESLRLLGGLGAEYGRRLSLYALLAETVLAGLGDGGGGGGAQGRRLAREAPESWVHILRVVAGWRTRQCAATCRARRSARKARSRPSRNASSCWSRTWPRALACALPGADHSQGESKDMNDSEQARTLRWPGDPATVAAESVDFEAVAHVLGNTCCWGGRSRRFYSLAQHALTVSGASIAWAA